jgi:hypothetical protein
MDATLLPFVRKYLWWWDSERPIDDAHRVIAQVMDIGTFEDVQELRTLAGDDALREALIAAKPGEFSPRSWNYWHLMLEVADLDDVPPLPSRRYI